jgi:hypothetical protein
MARLDTQAMLTFPIASFAFNLQPYIFPVFFPTKETSLGNTVKRLMFDEVKAPVESTAASCRLMGGDDVLSRALVDVVQENTFLNEVGVQMKKNRRFQTWRNRWVIIIAMVLSFFVYLLAGVVGYLHVRHPAGSGGTETGHAERRDGYVI